MTRQRRLHPIKAIAASTVILGLLAGCGSTQQPSDPATPPPPAVEASPTPTPTVEPTTPEQTPTETATPTPEATPTAPAKPKCPGDPKLPEGADERACGTMPKGAVNLTKKVGFATPSGNIWCDTGYQGDGWLQCFIQGRDFKDPKGPSKKVGEGSSHWEPGLFGVPLGKGKASAGLWSSEPGEAYEELQEGRLPILEYGSVARVDSIACASQKTGLTCWNTKTGHGFFLSRAAYKVW